MKILVLHQPVAADAPPEEQDTLIAAQAVTRALRARGHAAAPATFQQDTLAGLLEIEAPDLVFNLVEGIDGKGALAPLAPKLFSELGVKFTGTSAAAMDLTNHKPLAKQRIREAGLATPDWSEGPDWAGLYDGDWIVKSSAEDASLGLDDGCVVQGALAVKTRAAACTARHGGPWFAEQFIDGREFNISVLGPRGKPRILPLAEMRFESWPQGKPRIVGYGAKWEEDSTGWNHTVRHFGAEREEPSLAERIKAACEKVWDIFDLSGFVRVDFRIDEAGTPFILEINANPCISPDAGLAAAAAEAGLSYDDLIEEIVQVAA
jgi:D-alanine-D-alanine ligase